MTIFDNIGALSHNNSGPLESPLRLSYPVKLKIYFTHFSLFFNIIFDPTKLLYLPSKIIHLPLLSYTRFHRPKNYSIILFEPLTIIVNHFLYNFYNNSKNYKFTTIIKIINFIDFFEIVNFMIFSISK